MYFKFKYNQTACCGGKSNQVELKSAPYQIHPESPVDSVVTAFDRFANNYRSTPIAIIVSPEEMALLQAATASSFALVNQVLTYRKVPIKVE